MSIFFDPSSGRTQSWSCGGGAQSTAIAVLICMGKLPKPDIAVMVDTEREKAETFRYLRAKTIPALAAVGVNLIVIPKSDYATCDLTSTNGKHMLMPGFTDITGKPGKPGKLSNYCSGEWKAYVVDRYLRKVRNVVECDQWIGISVDEMKRVRVSRSKWQRLVYPLIDLGMSRSRCLQVVKEAGWPAPPRSACWMCPNQHDREWADLKANAPDDFARAEALERELQQRDPNFWLHKSCIPIGRVEFKVNESTLFDAGCNSGMCMI